MPEAIKNLIPEVIWDLMLRNLMAEPIKNLIPLAI